jgi:hypothetical protein
MRGYKEINGFTVFESDYDNYKGKYQLNGLYAIGMIGTLYRWLCNNGLEDYLEFDDVYNNTSGLRDGNRLDIMDNYNLTDDGKYQISYVWALENGIVYATVYDSEEDKYVGNIEILC